MRIIIAENEMRISKTVRGMFPLANEGMLRRAFSKRDFKVNGARTGEDVLLSPGDELAIYIDDKYLLPPVAAVYRDRNIIVIDKPRGIDVYGMAFALEEKLGCPVFPVHRLDAPTSGLLVFALNGDAEKALLDAFEMRETEKLYQCIVKGVPAEKSGTLTHFLVKDSEKAIVRAHDSPRKNALTAVCEYRALKTSETKSLVEVALHTGRTHQIRVQMAKIGHPVLGDDKYGNREFNRGEGAKRLMLCAFRLTLFFGDGPLSYLDGKTFEIKPPFEGGF